MTVFWLLPPTPEKISLSWFDFFPAPPSPPYRDSWRVNVRSSPCRGGRGGGVTTQRTKKCALQKHYKNQWFFNVFTKRTPSVLKILNYDVDQWLMKTDVYIARTRKNEAFPSIGKTSCPLGKYTHFRNTIFTKHEILFTSKKWTKKKRKIKR